MGDAYDFWARRLPRDDMLAVDDFWRRFAEIAPRIERYFRGEVTGIDIDAAMREVLGRLTPRLSYDFEPQEDGSIALVLSAELRHGSRPLARCAVLRAPRLRRWSMRDIRSAAPGLAQAVRAILWRSRADALAVEEIRVRRGAHRLIELQAHGYGEAEFLGDQAGIVFSVLLGEAYDQDWLGPSVGRPLEALTLREKLFGRRPSGDDRWLEEFRETARGVIRALEADRPEFSFLESRMRVEDLCSFELRPVVGDPSRRRDAMLVQSRYRALAAARLAGARVTAARFSRHAEIFCALKIKRTAQMPFDEVADVASLGVRIEDAVMAEGVAAVTGRSVGLGHIYIDLAALDIDRLIPVLRAALAEEGITGPVWLLFDEAGLEDLYFPLNSRTPATPMA